MAGGLTQKGFNMESKKKKHLCQNTIVAIISCVLVLVAFGGIQHYKNNRWKTDLNVTYIGHDYDSGNYHYEITNRSNRTLSNVIVIFTVDNAGDDDFEVEYRLGTLRIGETTTCELRWSDVQRKAKELGYELFGARTDILKIEYK